MSMKYVYENVNGDVNANVYAYVYVYGNVYVYVCASICNAKNASALLIIRCLLSNPHMLSALIPMNLPNRGNYYTH